MNRVYQGRVNAVEVLKPGTKKEWEPLDPHPKIAKQKGEEALWQHHVLFQDAVNYYAFALAVMAEGMSQKNKDGKDEPTPMAEFAEQLHGNQKQGRDRIEGRWEDFTHKGTKREGLKRSLSRTLEIPLSEITWEKCAEKIFAAVLEKYPDRKDLDGNDILHGVINELFPLPPAKSRGNPKSLANEDPSWLCWVGKTGELPAEGTYRKQQAIWDFMDELFEADTDQLLKLSLRSIKETGLSGVNASVAEDESDTDWSSDSQEEESVDSEENLPDDDSSDETAYFTGNEAVTELKSYLETASRLLSDVSFLKDFNRFDTTCSDPVKELAKLSELIEPKPFQFQKWKKQGQDEYDTKKNRVALFVLFAFSGGSTFTAALLKAWLKRDFLPQLHKTDKKRYVNFVDKYSLADTEPTHKVEVARKAAAKQSAEQIKLTIKKTDFLAQIRRDLGFVFPSFTTIRGYVAKGKSMPCPHGEMAWKKFDNAAYEEAIKSPHQIRQKQKERDKERKDLEVLEKLYTGKGRLTGKGDDGEDEDRIPGGFSQEGDQGDPRFAAMEKIRAALRVEDGIEEGDYEYTISEAALRGYDELRAVWNKEVEAGEAFSEAKAEKLRQLLKEHQAEHRDDMGAARLFEEFLKEGNWCVWQNEKEEIEKERVVNNWSDNFVRDYQRYVEVVAQRKKKEKPIQYTPADASESRRLFDFKGGAGLKHLEKEGDLSFTTQIAVKQPDGLYHVQSVRVFYTAPRLLRDEVRVVSASENLKSANWAQPMIRALGVKEAAYNFSEHAVSLMPDWKPGSRSGIPDRLLLNFVIDLSKKRNKSDKTTAIEDFIAKLRKTKDEKWPWAMQFNWNGDKNESTLRWPHEDWSKVESKDGFPGRWFASHELTSFRLLAVDLGQKQAGAYALIEVSCRYLEEEKLQTRFIGHTEVNGESRDWYARVVLTGLHKLPGEDAEVLRPEYANGKPVPGTLGLREELSGSAGRKATASESDVAFKYLEDLEQLDLLNDGTRATKDAQAAMTEDDRSRELMEWRKKARELMSALTIPEQNTKMLVALNRARKFANRLHRWCWFLDPTETGEERKDADNRRRIAIKEIAGTDEHPWLDKGAHDLAKKIHMRAEEAQKAGGNISVPSDAKIIVPLRTSLESLLKQLPGRLEIVANRIYASRKGRFVWGKNPDKNDCHLLDFVQFTQEELKARKTISKDAKRLAGQRGLSMERIEQLEDLRKICQSLNQTLRRAIGGKPLLSRDDSIPDPCPTILAKLDEIKEQRRNQTAHMILVEALGLKLKKHSPVDQAKLMRMNLSLSALSLIADYPASAKRRTREHLGQIKTRIEKRIEKHAERWSLHGEYTKVDDKGRSANENPENWRGIVDFIVIEDLSRYRTSQSRAPRENSRLMKWCHRAVRDKLKEMCEPFGLPLVETPAAYSSRVCSRTGVAGFRATEISAASWTESKWRWKTRKPKDETKEKPEAKKQRAQWESLFEAIRKANEGRDGQSKGQKYRTLVVPEAGGSIFIPMADLDMKYERPIKDYSNPKKQRPIIRYLPVQLDDGQAKEPRLIHSDVNAAVNIGLRAVANPRTWSIHSRLRSEREGDASPKPRNKKPKKQKDAQPQADSPSEVKPDRFFVAGNEKRKFHPREKPKQKTSANGGAETSTQTDTRIKIVLKYPEKADLKSSESHHPNFFADVAKLQGTDWGAAELKGLEDGETAPQRLVSSKALWGFVNQQSWKRCMTINAARLRAWGMTPPEEWEALDL